MLNLVLFGGPGAGKGTQAAKLVERYGLLHVSTGDIIRGEIKNNTSLGLKAQKQMEGGGLVSDQLVVDMMADYIDNHKGVKGIIFDGFPRTTPQAEVFDTMLKNIGESVTLMVALDVNEKELVARLLNRGKDSGRADDRDIEVIKNRIAVYEAQTAIVKDFYAAQGKYHAVDGIGTIDQIFDRICGVIDAVK